MANLLITHCKNGHEYTPENTCLNGKGQRHCRTCKRIGAGFKGAHKMTLAERFCGKIDKSAGFGPLGECWHWIGSFFTTGYGCLSVEGKTVGAHRVSYELNKGAIPAGLQVCHHCDNPKCVNPAHLFVGTAAENQADKIAKGRSINQQKTHCPKGHEYTVENTYFHPAGRQCKECVRARNREYKAHIRGTAASVV